MKESFDNEGVYVNGALSGARTGTSKFTAYVSPYMVVSQGGNYTKHIYMGSQRITSKVSNSGIFAASPINTTDLQAKLTLQTTNIKVRFDSLGVKYSGAQQTGGLVSASPAITADSYFYHPDHLGSSSLITNKDGELVQHIQYVPFGEVFVEERNATWSTPYKFNGKEQDEETGLCYYGARYYDPRTSVWLSVDPLAEKKPWMTSYNYCSNNPINRIDPDGRDDFDADGNRIKDIKKSNNIYMNIDGKRTLVSKVDLKTHGKGVNKVINYYGGKVSLKNVGISKYTGKEKGALAFTQGKKINVVDKDGHIDESLSDKYAMMSTLGHEKDHLVNGHGIKEPSNFEHAEVYSREVDSENFNNAPKTFQEGILNTMASLIEKAVNIDKISDKQAENLINSTNSKLKSFNIVGEIDYQNYKVIVNKKK